MHPLSVEGCVELASLDRNGLIESRHIGAFVVIDEAQNCTYAQIKMLLTRLGWHSTMVLTGDPDQTDLLPGISGFAEISRRVETVPGIAVVRLDDADIVRHPLVARMLGVL
jgi:phosphate starvation-inducible PhoH-like protein